MSKKFCNYANRPCPDCGAKLLVEEIRKDGNGVSYVEKFEVCDECGYNRNITDKRNKNTKIEIEE